MRAFPAPLLWILGFNIELCHCPKLALVFRIGEQFDGTSPLGQSWSHMLAAELQTHRHMPGDTGMARHDEGDCLHLAARALRRVSPRCQASLHAPSTPHTHAEQM